jgi:hypothetical protein
MNMPLSRFATEASMIIEPYKNYEIEPFESSPYKWRARIRRLDGKHIRTFVPENVMVVFTTGGMESLSPDDAIELAKRIIDGRGLI